MKKIVLPFLILAVAISCSKKTTPSKAETAASNTAATGEQVATDATMAAPVSAELAAGKTTYEAKCGRCHELHNPAEYTATKWTGIVGWMAPKAKLTEDEKKNVLAYVHANAKQ